MEVLFGSMPYCFRGCLGVVVYAWVFKKIIGIFFKKQAGNDSELIARRSFTSSLFETIEEKLCLKTFIRVYKSDKVFDTYFNKFS